MAKKGSDPIFPKIIAESQSLNAGRAPEGISLSAHEQKEAQIYRTMSEMPGRHIQFVEQKTNE